jgi:hypothetical protein
VINLEWNQVLPVIGVITVLLGGVMLYVRQKLDGVFARSSEVASMREALEGRMETMERKMATMPDHADVRALGARMSNVESGVAVLGAQINGLAEGVRRVEHMVDLLVKHQMDGDK